MRKLKELNQEDFAMEIIEDLGMQFETPTSKSKSRRAIFECTRCRVQFSGRTSTVKRRQQGTCKPCAATTHGNAYHKLFTVYSGERARCTNSTNIRYPRYGGRGITFSKEFEDFNVWLGYVESLDDAYKKGYTIDRKDNDGNYERGNLRWTSREVQAQNTTRIQRNNTSGYRGVSKSGNKWIARISVCNKNIPLGSYKTALEAAHAYDAYVSTHTLDHTTNILKGE